MISRVDVSVWRRTSQMLLLLLQLRRISIVRPFNRRDDCAHAIEILKVPRRVIEVQDGAAGRGRGQPFPAFPA